MYLNIDNKAATIASLITYSASSTTNIPKLYIDHVSFSAFSSTSYGAILYSSNSINLTFNSCMFINSTSARGGSFYFYNGISTSIVINSCQFINNKAQVNGGVMYIYSNINSISILSSTFYGNSAVTGYGSSYLN